MTNKPTINYIFADNKNWDFYRLNHRNDLREVETSEVEKMLTCQTDERGYKVYHCKDCNEYKTIHFGCNSRCCTHCGKKFTDRWANNIARYLYDCPHRHVILTAPPEIWQLLRDHRELHKPFMDCAIEAIEKMFQYHLGLRAVPGIVAVLHTYGKDMKFNAHVHCITTDGAFTERGWTTRGYFPYRMIRRCWQHAVLKMLREHLGKEAEPVIDKLYRSYPNGFYVRARDVITDKAEMARYIGRYVRHPAVAESRIDLYDGKVVNFHYTDNDKNRQDVVMDVGQFISAVIGHIPDKHFKVVRYYGVYSRRKRTHYQKLYGLATITQQKLPNYPARWAPSCDICGQAMELVYIKGKGPPEAGPFGGKIADWLRAG